VYTIEKLLWYIMMDSTGEHTGIGIAAEVQLETIDRRLNPGPFAFHFFFLVPWDRFACRLHQG
jgi:hypothetical protein